MGYIIAFFFIGVLAGAYGYHMYITKKNPLTKKRR
jgi:hypothetical protein